MYAYCLFCNTAKCSLVAEGIRRKLDCDAFSPQIIQRKWIRGEPVEEVHAYLPGYVFVYTETPIESFEPIRRMEGVLRCLGEKKNGYILCGDDRRFADMLYAGCGTIGIMKVYEEGEKVKLLGDTFDGFEGEIIRLDRRKGRAQIRYTFDQTEYKVWVGYELIK